MRWVSAGYGAQHACTETNGTRETRLRSPGRGSAARISLRRNRAAAQRESEGAVVLQSAVWQNAAGGKGPCSGHIDSARTCEGMSGMTGTNSPGRPRPPVKVRQLQRRLWAAAKRSPERRFHALMDRVWRADLLWTAWWRVRCPEFA